MSRKRKPAGDHCALCRFCHETQEKGQGACRRYPPAVLLRLDGQITCTYPIVRTDFSCGEFLARDQ